MVTIKVFPKTIDLSEKEYILYRNILSSLGIPFDVNHHIVSQEVKIIADLEGQVSVRLMNVLKSCLPSLSITITEFVETYSIYWLKKQRCAGPKSIKELQEVLKELGYMFM